MFKTLILVVINNEKELANTQFHIEIKQNLWEKIFTNYTSYRELVFRTHNKLNKLNIHKTTQLKLGYRTKQSFKKMKHK